MTSNKFYKNMDITINNIYDNLSSISNQDNKLNIENIEEILINNCGINQTFLYKSFNFRRPLHKLSQIDSDDFLTLYSQERYNIIFINYGIRICMTKDFIEKINPLNSIILKQFGNDYKNLIQLQYYSTTLNKNMKGSFVYISQLPIESLIIEDIPKSIKIKNRDDNILDTWFQDDNVATMITKELWYN